MLEFDYYLKIVDEAESFFLSRVGNGENGNNKSMEGIKNFLLSQIDGIEGTSEAIIVASVNHPWVLDKAFQRRFRLIEVPHQKTDEEKWRFVTEYLSPFSVCLSNKDWKTLKRRTRRFTGE